VRHPPPRIYTYSVEFKILQFDKKIMYLIRFLLYPNIIKYVAIIFFIFENHEESSAKILIWDCKSITSTYSIQIKIVNIKTSKWRSKTRASSILILNGLECNWKYWEHCFKSLKWLWNSHWSVEIATINLVVGNVDESKHNFYKLKGICVHTNLTRS